MPFTVDTEGMVATVATADTEVMEDYNRIKATTVVIISVPAIWASATTPVPIRLEYRARVW